MDHHHISPGIKIKIFGFETKHIAVDLLLVGICFYFFCIQKVIVFELYLCCVWRAAFWRNN